jgi:putative endonuclease
MKWLAWLAERFRTPTFGELGERQAAKFLKRLGYTIVARRYRNRFGEFDLVAVDGETVVFVEVKSRRTEAGIRPADSVGHVRQQRMTRAATAYLKSFGLLESPARFDIVEVIWPKDAKAPEVRHLVNAFVPEGSGQFFR